MQPHLTATQITHHPQIAEFCRRWQIIEFALFGSVLRPDFRDDSDIDVLVSFMPDAPWTLLDLVAMQTELQTIFGRKVDLLTKNGVKMGRNLRRRAEILSTAQVIYAA